MFKRIMKVMGIVLACFVLIAGASVGIYALQGGFKEVKIDIMKLYFDAEVENTDETEFSVSETLTKQTIYTLTDVTTKIDFEPFDSTEKNLTVKITGVDGVLDNKSELEKGIVAGEDFTLKIRKDSQGNNHGGVVNLTATSPNGIAQVTITLVVDVPIPDNSIYFSGDTNNRVTASGKAFTLAKNNVSSYIYLKSELYNAFYLPVSENNFATVTGNLKSTKISYEYYGLDGSPLEGSDFIREYDFDDLEIVSVYDNITHTYAYYYKVPVVPKESGTIKFTAKTHRSYTIQREFEESGFDNLETVLANSSLSQQHASEAATMRRSFTNFINKYIAYFDDTEESYNFFRSCINNNGLVELTASQAVSALKYVYVTCTATVDVTAVNLNQITSVAEPITYNVFDTVDFAKKEGLEVDNRIAETIYDEFDLTITLNGENGEVVEGTADEESTLFDTLDMGAYVYMSADSITPDEGDGTDGIASVSSVSTSYDEVIPVYGFDENLPITPYIAETLTLTEQAEYQDDSGNYITIGYLYKIKTAMTSNKFMEINANTINGEVCWSVNFNVPLTEVIGETEINKALYFRFAVNGVDIKTSARIDRETFTRIYINFTEYEYASSNSSQLTIQSTTESGSPTAIKTSMALNSSLDNADAYALNTQAIQIDTSSETILNYNGAYSDGVKTVREVEYKSVMYFAEESSNAIGDQGAKQIVTIGKYNFSSMNGVPYTFNPEENLVGERIPTYNIVDGAKQFYIQTVNASQSDENNLKKPVKIFAVVYLSDKNGNPIDLSGQKININEDAPEEPTMIYVIAMSDISTSNMTNIVIHNFVDNVNFYTQMASTITLCKDSEVLPVGITYDAEEWVKRNSVTSFVYEDGASQIELTGADLDEYQDFLRLKLLRNKEFNLYLTNFEMSSSGDILDSTEEKTYRVIDINGNVYDERPYIVNTKDNKQIALNNLCTNFTSNYGLSAIENVSVDTSKIQYKQTEAGDYQYVSFVIKANSEALTNTNYSLYLINKNKSAPYSNEAASDRTSLTVNKIDIYDVTLNEVEQRNTLYASYISKDYTDSLNTGKIQFNELSSDGTQKTPYVPLSIDEITYSVSTNLVTYSTEGGYVVNTDIVDASQAIYQKVDEGDGEETQNEDVGNDIESYIEYYSQTGLNVTKSYTAVTKFAKLKSDLVYEWVGYKNQVDPSDDGELNSFIIGNSVHQARYYENGDKGDFYNFGGGKYYVTDFPFQGTVEDGDLRIVYPANSYFPVISVDGKNVMLALGEEFEIYQNTQGYYVFKQESVTGSVSEIAVEVVSSLEVDGISGTYSSSKYISNTTDSFELKMGEDHTTRYFEDENGQYGYDSSLGKYYLVEEGYTGKRYTPQSFEGVTTYLLINFGFIPLNPDEYGNLEYELEINKVLSFDLVQNDLNFTFFVGEDEGTEIINSTANRLEVQAGEETLIQLNPNGTIYPSIHADDTNIFSHISIENSIDGVTIEQTHNRIITINTTKNFGTESNQSFKIKYNFKGQIVEHEFYIKILPNYGISYSGDTSTSSYIMNVDAYGVEILSGVYGDNELTTDSFYKTKTYHLSQILGLETGAMAGLFAGSYGFESYTLSLKGNYGKNITFNADAKEITVGESLVMSGKEYIELNITLKIGDDNYETLTRTLRINVNPTYIVSFSGLSDTSTNTNKVYNGEKLFGYHIIANGYNSDTGEYTLGGRNSIGVALDYASAFSITANGESCDGTLDIYDLGAPVKEDTLITLSIVFGNNITVTKYITINGIELYYSRVGDIVSGAYESVSNYSVLQSDIVIDLVAGQTINLDTYFAFYTANGGAQLNVALKASGSESYIYDNISAVAQTYDIYYTLSEGGQYKYITDTSFTLTIRVINAYVSSTGEFADSQEYDSEIHTEENKLDENVSITVATGTVIDLDNYIAMYLYDSGEDSYTILPAYIYKDGGYVNTLTTTSTGTTTYQIYFREVVEGSDPAEYKYNSISYTITIVVTA